MSVAEVAHFRHSFDNGLVLLGELLPWLNSVSFDLAIPAGAAYDPEDKLGLAALTTDMILRGAGDRDARRFLEDLENMGVVWSDSVGRRSIHLVAAMRPNVLPETLAIFRDAVLRPQLPAKDLESARASLIQKIQAVEDDPAARLEKEIRSLFFPYPWNRRVHGELEHVSAITWDDVAGFVQDHFRPQGATLAVAGRFDWDQLVSIVGELFGQWNGVKRPLPPTRPSEECRVHVPFESQQTHIGIAYPAIPYDDERYYAARAAVEVLGGGSSARLFTELREKRGLCYSVSAQYVVARRFGGVLCYVGTTAEIADHTLRVLLTELRKLAQGIREDELARVKAQLKSGLIFLQESSSARARSLTADWSLLGRIRPLAEVKAAVDALTVDQINSFLRDHPPDRFTIVTVGPQPVEVPCDLL